MDKKEQTRLRVQRYRDKQKSVTDVTLNNDSVTQSGENVTLIFPPSKFLSPEQDRRVQENVINALKAMTGSRRQSFRALSNTFIPNAVKDPTLNRPEL